MRIFGKHVKGKAEQVTDATDGQLAIYNASAGMWIAIDAGDIPVEVAGVTATTLNAALLEIFSAI